MNHDSCQELWQLVWSDGIDIVRRFSGRDGIKYDEYLSRLICFYLICFIRKGDNTPADKIIPTNSDRPYAAGMIVQIEKDKQMDGWIEKMMVLFYQILEMPILVLHLVRSLLEVGIRWEVFTGGTYRDFFESEFKRAALIADGQKKYN